MRVFLSFVLFLVSPAAFAADCTITSQAGKTPAAYVRSPAHLAAGLIAKTGIVPRDAAGNPSATGKIIHVAIGSSLQRAYIGDWMYILAANPTLLNPKVSVVRAAESGATTELWANPGYIAWTWARTAVANYGSSAQVQSAHVSIANVYGHPIPRAQIAANVQILLQEYPNIKAVWISGAAYTGYEGAGQGYGVQMPYSHASSLLLAQMVTENIDWPAGVWVDFLDMWANGTTPNPYTMTGAFPSGLSWVCADFAADGYHPSYPIGSGKAASYIHSRLREDPVASFLWTAPPAPPPPPPPPTRIVTVQGSADGVVWTTVGSVTVPLSLPITRTVEP